MINSFADSLKGNYDPDACTTQSFEVDIDWRRQSITAVGKQCTVIARLILMTHAPETGAINRLHFLAPVFGAGFSLHIRTRLE